MQRCFGCLHHITASQTYRFDHLLDKHPTMRFSRVMNLATYLGANNHMNHFDSVTTRPLASLITSTTTTTGCRYAWCVE